MKSRKLLASVALFPERAHLVGAYSLGKAQRIIALIRAAGYDRPIYIHGALEKLMDFYAGEGIPLGEIRKVSATDRASSAARSSSCRRARSNDLWSRKFPDPVTAFASGWMRIRARARQGGVTLPLVISDHADWDGLCTTIRDTGCSEVWVTHGEEDALVHWARTQGLDAQPLHMIGYGDEGEEEGGPSGSRGRRVNRFAELLDRLAYEPSRNAKLRLVADYFRSAADPDRGFALAAMTGALVFANAKPGLIRALIAERTDPVLFAMSYDYVGDLSETVALMWPAPGERRKLRHSAVAHRSRRNLAERRQARSAAPSRRIGSTGSTRPGAGPC